MFARRLGDFKSWKTLERDFSQVTGLAMLTNLSAERTLRKFVSKASLRMVGFQRSRAELFWCVFIILRKVTILSTKWLQIGFSTRLSVARRRHLPHRVVVAELLHLHLLVLLLALVLDGKVELELGRKLLLRVESVGEVDSPDATVCGDLQEEPISMLP